MKEVKLTYLFAPVNPIKDYLLSFAHWNYGIDMCQFYRWRPLTMVYILWYTNKIKFIKQLKTKTKTYMKKINLKNHPVAIVSLIFIIILIGAMPFAAMGAGPTGNPPENRVDAKFNSVNVNDNLNLNSSGEISDQGSLDTDEGTVGNPIQLHDDDGVNIMARTDHGLTLENSGQTGIYVSPGADGLETAAWFVGDDYGLSASGGLTGVSGNGSQFGVVGQGEYNSATNTYGIGGVFQSWYAFAYLASPDYAGYFKNPYGEVTSSAKTTAVTLASNTAAGYFEHDLDDSYGSPNKNTVGLATSQYAVVANSKVDTAIYAESDTGMGIHAKSNKVALRADATTDTAIWANSNSGLGIDARSTSNNGINALSDTGYGIYAKSNKVALRADATTDTAIWANSNSGLGIDARSTTGTAGRFNNTSGPSVDLGTPNYAIDAAGSVNIVSTGLTALKAVSSVSSSTGGDFTGSSIGIYAKGGSQWGGIFENSGSTNSVKLGGVSQAMSVIGDVHISGKLTTSGTLTGAELSNLKFGRYFNAISCGSKCLCVEDQVAQVVQWDINCSQTGTYTTGSESQGHTHDYGDNTPKEVIDAHSHAINAIPLGTPSIITSTNGSGEGPLTHTHNVTVPQTSSIMAWSADSGTAVRVNSFSALKTSQSNNQTHTHTYNATVCVPGTTTLTTIYSTWDRPYICIDKQI